MKYLIVILNLFICLPSFGVERKDLEQLLIEKGTSIAAFEAQGMKLIMGERTGGGRNLQFASIEVIFIKDEAVLKNEIQNIRPTRGNRLEDLDSIQASGRQFDTKEIIGVIIKQRP